MSPIWRRRRRESDPPQLDELDEFDELVEEAGEESFPASDPPAWTTGRPKAVPQADTRP